ncbi:bifunctional enzyme IspD/IspF [Arthrobacter sp. MYb227]|uniref:2-C-methyl-D-erythritol 4-phosphate cytidylyltransferase n=1 Tax=Arthrobacter sp. MYb227 TaxID=1848601 RepID=UPI000CFDC33A|nr:2-C-methyl-D-erythritol 4-phosphate cytidylyltransferase [Arthrobacter sp. MYb227]PQZ85968.1 bifunctional enzyme IspD/IspF [Arthrobacter sp. MYb227]
MKEYVRSSNKSLRHTAVIVVAAGAGTRLGYGIPKALVQLNGRSLLEHALDNIAESSNIDQVIVVLPPDDTELTRRCKAHRVNPHIVDGGATRNDSVQAGLSCLAPQTQAVLIHDAARCLTPGTVFDAVAQTLASGAKAVIPVLPVIDTIKSVAREPIGDYFYVNGTPARESLRAVQTPQGFHAPTLISAHEQATGWDAERAGRITDDAMLLEMLGERVTTIRGCDEALKITTPMDLIIAQAILAQTPMSQSETETTEHEDFMSQPQKQSNTAASPVLIPRIGIGIDIHAVADRSEPREMWLAGLHFPEDHGLSGHSDGDAVAHAACDALFSAAGIGDLGTHFGTDRPEYAGASGITLLAEAARLVRAAGFEIGNVAVQFVGRRPKFAARRLEADAVLSKAAGAPITVTATTSDGLGYEGTGDGVTAYATALVYSVAK